MTNSITDQAKIVKNLIEQQQYEESERKIIEIMINYPHSAVSHNLYGILLEAQQDHVDAMKHFRAAYALDPTYIPSRYNLERYGSFDSYGFAPAYSEEDCVQYLKKNKDTQFEVRYDEHHVGHILRKLTGGKE